MSELSAQRLRLRPLAACDRDDFLRMVGDPELTKHMDGPVATEAAQALFARIVARAPEDALRVWAIVRRADEAYLGHAGLIPRPDGSTELLFLLDEPHWGQGYATEAAGAVLRHGLEARGLARVLATVDEDHPASIRVLEKLGMRLERRALDDGPPYLVYEATPSG